MWPIRIPALVALLLSLGGGNLFSTVPLTSNPSVSLRRSGVDVNPHTGALSAGIPLGVLPGEIPVPISLGIQGRFEADYLRFKDPSQINAFLPVPGSTYIREVVVRPAFGILHFGFIRNAWQRDDGSLEPPITILEDGEEYDGAVSFATAHPGESLLLPAAYGFQTPSAAKVDNRSEHLFFMTAAAGLGTETAARIAAHLPVGTGVTSSSYQVVMDRNLARVFASAPALGGWIPVLWMDRFGHYVTFDWSRSADGLPSGATAITSLIITNSRGRKAELRWADWSDPTVVHDLLRVDFLNVPAPSMVVQGYSGVSCAFPAPAPDSEGVPGFVPPFPIPTSPANGQPYIVVAPLSCAGGPVGRPTSIWIGDPDSLPEPAWNNSGPSPARQPILQGSGVPSLATRAWEFEWDSSLASLVRVTSPSHVTTTFSYSTYGVPFSGSPSFDPAVYAVIQRDDRDGSGAHHCQVWSRLPVSTLLPTTVEVQDWWPSAGSNDRKLVLTYDAAGVNAVNDIPSKSVLETISGSPLVTTTQSLASAGYASQDAASTSIRTTYAPTLGLPDHQVTFSYLPGSADLQTSVVIDFAIPNGSAGSGIKIQDVRATYAARWGMLDSGEITQSTVTRYAPDGATPMAPILKVVNDYDVPAQGVAPALERLKSYQQVGQWQHGMAWTYDAEGRIASQAIYDSPDGGSSVSSSPRTSSLDYDPASGSLASIRTAYQIPGASASGQVTQSQGSFDGSGRPSIQTDALGVSSALTFDLLGRIASLSRPGQPDLSLAWSSDELVETLDRGETRETFLQDGFGRPVEHDLADGKKVLLTYDIHGRRATEKVMPAISSAGSGKPAMAQLTTWSYDVLDRPVSQTDPSGVTINLTYSASGIQAVEDEVNVLTNLKVEISTDPFGQRTRSQVSEWSGSAFISAKTATYAYDGLGHLIQVVETDPRGVSQTRSFIYDANGHLIRKVEPETNEQDFSNFNALGLPQTIALGVSPAQPSQGGQGSGMGSSLRTLAVAYDGLGRQISLASGADQLSWTFAGPLLAQATSTSGGLAISQRFSYLPPASGALLSSESTQTPDFSATIQYAYAPDGRVQAITYPSGRVVSYGYDNLGRVNTVSQMAPGGASGSTVATVAYGPSLGLESAIQFASGASSQWTAEADGIHLKQWSIQLADGAKLDGDRLYAYDNSKDHLSQAGEWALTHDARGRLTAASAPTLGAYGATYGYDAFDNNTTAAVTGTTPPQAIGFAFGALPANQTPSTTIGGSATGWIYDAAGEATNFGAGVGSTPQTGLTWDGLGRLSRVTAPGLTEVEGYAPSGLRVRRDDSVAGLSRRYAYTTGGLLLGEYVPTAGGGFGWNRDVIYLGSEAIAEVDGAGVHELHSDHLGTPRIITGTASGAAAVEGRQVYGPYGETFPAMNSGYQPLTGYTGHLQTDPTGLIYMRGRFYTPIWHRFVNSDQGADPSTFNQLSYAAGTPMMKIDPSGGRSCLRIITSIDWQDDSTNTSYSHILSDVLICDGGGRASQSGEGGDGTNGNSQTPRPHPCPSGWSKFAKHFSERWSAPGQLLQSYGVSKSVVDVGRGLTVVGALKGVWSVMKFGKSFGLGSSVSSLTTFGDFTGATGAFRIISQVEGIANPISLGLFALQAGYAVGSAAGALGDTIADDMGDSDDCNQ